MRFHISQFSCLCKIFKCFIAIPFFVEYCTHVAKRSRIICLHSFLRSLYTFFLIWRCLSAEWASIASIILEIGKQASITNHIAAACFVDTFVDIKRQRQEANRALSTMALIGLSK
jgi:hypothetical protein